MPPSHDYLFAGERVRTLDEILADVHVANAKADDAMLLCLAEEMAPIDGELAHASSLQARGSALLMRSEYQQARACLVEALKLFTHLKDGSGIAAALLNIGLCDMHLGDHEEAIAKFEQASALCIENDDTYRAAIATNSIGLIHLNNAALDLALPQFRRALDLFASTRHISGQGMTRGNIGLVYYRSGRYAEALEEYHHALSLHEQGGNKPGTGGMHVNIANVYNVTGNYPQALHHFHHALEIATEIDSPKLMVLAMGNIGTVYGAMGEYDNSLEYFQRTLHKTESFNDHASRVSCLCNIGRAHAHLGDIQTAIRSATDAVDLCLTFNDKPSLMQAVTCLAMMNAQASLFDEAEKALELYPQSVSEDPAPMIERELCYALIHAGRERYEEAATSLQSALSLSVSSGRVEDQVKAHRQLRDLAQKRGDFASYIEHNDAIQRLTDEYNGKKTAQRISMMEAERRLEHERAERDKERALLYGTLPESVAQRILRGEDVSGDHVEMASVLFLDIVGFTSVAERMQPDAVVRLLGQFYSALDAICRTHDVTKIKTIGDSYMAVAFPASAQAVGTDRGDGDPDAVSKQDVQRRAALTAVEMLDVQREQFPGLPVRIGVHCGPVTAGVIGTERLQYDVWGDTVNIASRMESHGDPGRIHVSEAFAYALQSVDGGQWTVDDLFPHPPIPLSLHQRGTIDIKGKGPMTTYWLEGALS